LKQRLHCKVIFIPRQYSFVAVEVNLFIIIIIYLFI